MIVLCCVMMMLLLMKNFVRMHQKDTFFYTREAMVVIHGCMKNRNRIALMLIRKRDDIKYGQPVIH